MMPHYELYVITEADDGRTGEQSIKIKANTDEEAIEKSKRVLIGDPEQWKGRFIKRHGRMKFEFELDPEEEVARETGHIVFLEADHSHIFKARLHRTQTVHTFDLDDFRRDIAQAVIHEKRRCEADPEYKKYLKLKDKFEG